MDIDEISRRIEAIRQDQQQGPTQLARAAVELLAEMASDCSTPNKEFADRFRQTARELAEARPSTASLLNAVGSVVAAWLEAGGIANPTEARAAVDAAARRWKAKQDASASIIADHAAEVVSGVAITLGYSRTVMRALEQCWDRGVLAGVIVAESRPLFEGRSTVADLASRGIPAALITDAEIGVFAPTANAAVVGANTILQGGTLVNKVGTLLLALAARRRRVPFFALAEMHKIAPSPRRLMPFFIDEKPPDQVLPEPISGVAVRNVSLDLTPASYITGYITEEGVLDRQDVAAAARNAPAKVLRSRF